MIAIAFIALLIFRRHKRGHVRPDTPSVPEMNSYQRHELTAGPQGPTSAVPTLQRPELDVTTPDVLPGRSELANDTIQRGTSHDLAPAPRHELPSRNVATTADPTTRTATSTFSDDLVSRPIILTPLPSYPESSAESRAELTEEADTLVAELGVIYKRRKTLTAAATAAGVVDPNDIEGRKGDEYRKLVTRERNVRESMAEVQNALRAGDAGG